MNETRKPAAWARSNADPETWVLPGVGKVVRREVLRAEGNVQRYIPFSADGTSLNFGWRHLGDAMANVEAHARGEAY